MTDLHPEELLHRAAAGTLVADERARLRAHLDECEGCRLELAVRRAAARQARPRRGDERRLERLATAAVSRARRREPAAPVPRIGTWTGFGLGAAAGILLLLVSAWVVRVGHGVLAGRDATPSQAEATRTAEPEAGPVSERAATTATVERGTASPEPSAAEEAPPMPEPESVPASASDGLGPSLERAADRSRRATLPRAPAGGDATPSATGETADDAATTADASVPALLDAAALFERGTAASREGDATTALATFRSLRERFPTSREARTSWVLSGRLLLAAGEATAALQCFDAYLEHGGKGPLVPEAMAGRAAALHRLGRTGEARAQWEAIMARFPRSSAATEARTRLEEEAK